MARLCRARLSGGDEQAMEQAMDPRDINADEQAMEQADAAEPWKIENYRVYVACEKHHVPDLCGLDLCGLDRNKGAKPAGGGV